MDGFSAMHPYANADASNRAQQAAQALNSAISNPYRYSAHYAQAYFQQQASGPPLATLEGYSLSSTYVPSLPTRPGPLQSRVEHQLSREAHGSQHPIGGRNRFHNQRGYQQQTHWYEPGDYRCTHWQCSFTGSKKSVEMHMMDRHLVYPPGWENRKRKDDWDADPSLKGKQIPIQGTNIVLDTPEAIESWIAERKKRWPTTSRVQEKEAKLKEALDRGDISASGLSLRGRKRPREDDSRGKFRGRGRGGGGGGGGAVPIRTATVHPLPKKPVTIIPAKASECTDDEISSSGSDMDPDKDAISSKPPYGIANATVEVVTNAEEIAETEDPKSVLEPINRRSPRRPKPTISQRNPYGSRPSLLRNLLLPEIRMTVSNLSQAIHFLVENDFLEDVELNPGEAENKPIEIISESNSEVFQ